MPPLCRSGFTVSDALTTEIPVRLAAAREDNATTVSERSYPIEYVNPLVRFAIYNRCGLSTGM